jgi:hypothetical protein
MPLPIVDFLIDRRYHVFMNSKTTPKSNPKSTSKAKAKPARKPAPKPRETAPEFEALFISHTSSRSNLAVVTKTPGKKTINVMWFKGENCYRQEEIKDMLFSQAIKSIEENLVAGVAVAKPGKGKVKAKKPAK